MKISIVGAGMTGSAAALKVAQLRLGDVVLVDIVEGLPQGKALDMQESAPLEGFDVEIVGSNDYAATAGSGIVVITSGLPRKPGMTRMDLLKANADIVEQVTASVASLSPDGIILMLTNPLDVMTYVAWKTSGFPKERVFGQAGVLDSTRMRTFVAKEAGVSVEDVHTMVLGGHGDSMVPLPRYTTVSGIPLAQLISQEQIEAINQRTRDGGAEIVGLLKTGSAFYAPGAAIAMMIESIVQDKKRILPASTLLEGEFGLTGVFAGVPIKLGRSGVERIVEIELTNEERKSLHASAADVREGIEVWEQAKVE